MSSASRFESVITSSGETEPYAASSVHRVMRTSLVAVAVTVAVVVGFRAASAGDRDPSDAAIRAKLSSPDPKEIAWGLHDAIHGHVRGLDELVRAVVGKHASRDLDRLAVDAILELDIPVEPAFVGRIEADLSVERRLLFASRDPRAYQRLLRRALVEDPRDDDAWTAAVTLLAPLRDRVLGRHLLSLLRLEAYVAVHDPGDDEDRPDHFESTVVGSGTGCGQVRDAVPGWPPRAHWILTRDRGDGRRIVAQGRTPIYAWRREVDVGDWICSSGPSRWSRRYHAPEVLADLLGEKVDSLRGLLSEYETVRYTGPESFKQGVEAVRARLLRPWIAIVGACVARGVIEPVAIFGLAPRITYEVDDSRTEREPALPKLPSGSLD